MVLERQSENIDSLECGSRVDKAVYLVWEDLSVVLLQATSRKNGGTAPTKKLLSGLSGYAEPGRIMAIMGPSGSGKSTLLDALAGRLSPGLEMTGKVLINGKKSSTNVKEVSYVAQEKIFLGIFTVRETLTYSAHLRLPREKSKEEINTLVEDTITEMGLQDCADNRIGNWYFRGISSGEKKRLSISIEILTNPLVLFLDEPTTGLDSASAFFVIRALRNISLNGRIVLCSIHQPSSDVFDLFDDLLLISCGQIVYFGETKMAVEFFAEAGFPCPTRRSPQDHYLRCISLDFDIVDAALVRSRVNSGIPTASDSMTNKGAAEIRERLVEKYKCSEYPVNTKRRIREIAVNIHLQKEVVYQFKKGSDASWWKQLSTLTQRSFVYMFIDIGYYWLRFFCFVSISLVIGILFYKMGTDNKGIVERAQCLSFVFGFMICISCGGLPFFIEELKVFYEERSSGHYGVAAYTLSNFISSLPFLVLTSIISGTIIYYMVQFHPGFSHYCFFCINLFCCLALIEAHMMIVASLVPNLLIGIGVGVGAIVFFMMASQMSRPLEELPRIFWHYPVSYFSFGRWAIQGEYKNVMIGLEFDPLVPGYPKLKGEEILQNLFGVSVDYSKWWDLSALAGLLLIERLLLFMVLKYKQQAFCLLCQFFNERNLGQSIFKKLIFKRQRFVSSSNRHQSDGLGSPLP